MTTFLRTLGCILAIAGMILFVVCSILMLLDQGWRIFLLSLLNPVTYLFAGLLVLPGYALIWLAAWLESRSETRALQGK